MLKNLIEIEFNHNIFKAFWNRDRKISDVNGYEYLRHPSQLIFVANTKEQAEQRATEFVEKYNPQAGITDVVFLEQNLDKEIKCTNESTKSKTTE